MSKEPEFSGRAALIASIRIILADRRWPLKVGLGGLFMLTLLGIILPQGYLVEHLDNSQRGFRTPLPLWRQIADKAIMGLLVTVLDFVYFVLPIILAGLLLFCLGLSLMLRNQSATSSSWILWVLPGALGIITLIAFGLSLSPLAKASFSRDGELEQSLGARALSRATDPLNRRMYLQARLASLPAYGPALAFGGLVAYLASLPGAPVALLLVAGWLLASSVFWAWLVVGQIYLPVIELAEDRILEARLAARQAALQNKS